MEDAKGMWYEIKWKGFAEPTWELVEDIHDLGLIRKYWKEKNNNNPSSTTTE